MTRIRMPDDGVLVHRVVIRDEVLGEIVARESVTGDTYLVDWAELDPKHAHRYRVQAWTAEGWRGRDPYQWLLAPLGRDEARGFIERPRQGANSVAIDPLEIRGWALFGDIPLVRVEVTVNGVPVGRARLGMQRLEVAAHLSQTDAPICGFQHLVAARDLPAKPDPRRTVVGAVAHGADGRQFELPDVVFMPEAARAEQRSPGIRRRPIHRPVRPRARGEPEILVFMDQLDAGCGANLYLAELFKGLGDVERLSFTVVSPADGPFRANLESAGVPVHVLDSHDFQTAEGYEDSVERLSRWAADRGFVAVIANTLQAAPGVDIATRAAVPGVWVIHESVELPVWEPGLRLGKFEFEVRERWRDLLSEADAVVFTAEATLRQYAHHGDRQRFQLIPYGIPIERIDRRMDEIDRAEARRCLGLTNGDIAILCLGAILPRKGQSLLARAFAELAEGHPDAVLLLVGDRGGEYPMAVREYLRRAGLTDRVRTLPVVDDPAPLHVAADVLVLPSDRESLPFVLLEAMAFGTPTLSTRVFGAAELIEDGKTGFLCEPRDLQALVAGLNRVLSASPQERGAIAAAGAEIVREFHDHRRYVASFGHLLDELIEQKAAPGHLASR